jgi:hypothetical protein
MIPSRKNRLMKAIHLETDLFEFWDDETGCWRGQFENPREDLVDVIIDGQKYPDLAISESVRDLLEDQGASGQINGVWMKTPGRDPWPALTDAMQPDESFARWLKGQLSDLHFEFDEPIGEDWGWGFFAIQEREKFWVAISFAGITDDLEAGCWVVSVDPQRGLLGLFRKKKPELLENLWSKIAETLEGTEGLRVTLRE